MDNPVSDRIHGMGQRAGFPIHQALKEPLNGAGMIGDASGRRRDMVMVIVPLQGCLSANAFDAAIQEPLLSWVFTLRFERIHFYQAKLE